MENATDALLIAFGVLVFIIALTITFTNFAQAKEAADTVLFFSDRENFQTPLKDETDDFSDGGRTVTVDTVIATIYRCAKEKFSVKIIDDSEIYNFEYDIQNQDEIKQEIQRFIENHEGNSYRETYVEVTTSGTIYFGEDEEGNRDGTQLEKDVGKKIYITYEKQ